MLTFVFNGFIIVTPFYRKHITLEDEILASSFKQLYSKIKQDAPPADTGSSSSSTNESYSGGSSSNSASSNTASGNGGSVVSAPSTAKKANSVTVGVEGGQKFRITKNNECNVFHIYHMGNCMLSFSAKDADGNAAAYTAVNLEKGEDGLWYLNATYPETVDTTALTMGTSKGDVTYL